jgi:hypothetical protein
MDPARQQGRLTYKSIIAKIASLEGAALKRFKPIFDPSESEKRELLMTAALHDWCYQSDSKKSQSYKGNVRAFLGRFVKGEHIDNCDFMKSWRDGVFEFRVQLDRYPENTRIFGGFAAPDCFVAIGPPRLRSDFGPKGHPLWDRQIERVMNRWTQHFSDSGRMKALPFRD